MHVFHDLILPSFLFLSSPAFPSLSSSLCLSLSPSSSPHTQSESLFLYGMMLMITDFKIEGPIRERMLVAFHRYSTNEASVDSNIDDVCKLLRGTGFQRLPVPRRPPKYPEDYFAYVVHVCRFVSYDIMQWASSSTVPRTNISTPSSPMLQSLRLIFQVQLL